MICAMTIDRNADRAVYRQLADLLRQLIRSGNSSPGTILPSENQLIRDYGVGRVTVRNALALLRSEGLVTTRRGFGTQVRGAPSRTVVNVTAGDQISARMPLDLERQIHRLIDGTPVLVIQRANGDTEVYPADRTELSA